MHFAFRWIFSNAQAISSLMAAAGALGAVRIYYWKVGLDRASWLSNLYSKFYEAADLKRIRNILDESAPDALKIQEMVDREDQISPTTLTSSNSWLTSSAAAS